MILSIILNKVQQICDENHTKGSVSDKSTNNSRKLAEMILFEISYGPNLNKSKIAVIFKMAAKFKKKSQNSIVVIKKEFKIECIKFMLHRDTYKYMYTNGQNGGLQDGHYFQDGNQFNTK